MSLRVVFLLPLLIQFNSIYFCHQTILPSTEKKKKENKKRVNRK